MDPKVNIRTEVLKETKETKENEVAMRRARAKFERRACGM
jgi:hypothetical protein